MQTIYTDTWHYRCYRWARNTWYWFLTKPKHCRFDEPREFTASNLCEYMRTITVGSLMAVLTFLSPVIMVGLWYWFLSSRYGSEAASDAALWIFAGAAAVVVTAIAVVFGFVFIGDFIKDKVPKKEKPLRPEPEKDEPGFLALVAEWIHNRHEEFCFSINFDKRKEEDH